ncbi:MAG: [FeFe] hydrogenase H-cluster radical SAM maturase HydE [Deltaproteobacteria bacterium]|nr:[FeFe] hydrogenase H-cluster radical SAM maturase HydE [Deltaproteobacteria bacterium]
MSTTRRLTDELAREGTLTARGFADLIRGRTPESAEYLFSLASEARDRVFGKGVFMRGLIEFSNHCRNDCLYCGIRRSNRLVERYRLTPEEILETCSAGHSLGFRTFVLQSGEDPGFGPGLVAETVSRIKASFPDSAVTLSLGEHPPETYALWRAAGADRYLLRHETRNPEHYASLHPRDMTVATRVKCLRTLKELGYQVGCGFMVGSPGQTPELLAEDLLFIRELRPHMVGIGPFIPHRDTPLASAPPGSVDETLYLLGILRLMDPRLLIPATTALGTLDGTGREKGVAAGANVIMPILTPMGVRGKYLLYDNKICTGDASSACRMCVQRRMESIGREIDTARGDHPDLLRASPCAPPASMSTAGGTPAAPGAAPGPSPLP